MISSCEMAVIKIAVTNFIGIKYIGIHSHFPRAFKLLEGFGGMPLRIFLKG